MFRQLFRPLCTVTARTLKNPQAGSVKMWLELPKGSELHNRFGDILNFEPSAHPFAPPPEAGIPHTTVLGSFSDKKPTKEPGEVEVSAQFSINDQRAAKFLNDLFPDYPHLTKETAVLADKHGTLKKTLQKETSVEVLTLKSGDADPKKVDAVAAPIMTKKLGLKKD